MTLNIRSGHGTTMKYLCEFWFSSLQWFRSCRVHKFSMAIAGWSSFLTHWPFQCHADLVLSNVISFIEIASFIQKIESEKHSDVQTYGQPDHLMPPAPNRRRRH